MRKPAMPRFLPPSHIFLSVVAVSLITGLCHVPVAGEERPEAGGDKGIKVVPQAEQWLKGLEAAFDIPADSKDSYGNAVRQGFDEATGWPLEIRHKATGMQLVFIPAGEFMMGSELSAKGVASKYGGIKEYFADEHPRHRVKISHPFYLGKYELTVRDFEKFVKAENYRTEAESGGGATVWTGTKWEQEADRNWKKTGFTQTLDHPVVCVSWNDVQAFCQWAGLKLPAEAEWEYACRGGTDKVRFWGDENKGAAQYANVVDETSKRKFNWSRIFDGEDDGYAETAPVGRFKPNPYGLYDILGNVYEWCQDWYGSYEGGTLTDPKGPKAGEYRVVRGGSWCGDPSICRAADRNGDHPSLALVGAGVRVCVRDF